MTFTYIQFVLTLVSTLMFETSCLTALAADLMISESIPIDVQCIVLAVIKYNAKTEQRPVQAIYLVTGLQVNTVVELMGIVLIGRF